MVPGVVVRDRGSRRGTSVNDTRIGSGEARDSAARLAVTASGSCWQQS